MQSAWQNDPNTATNILERLPRALNRYVFCVTGKSLRQQHTPSTLCRSHIYYKKAKQKPGGGSNSGNMATFNYFSSPVAVRQPWQGGGVAPNRQQP